MIKINRITLTKQQARRLILARQRLLPPRQLEGKEGVLQFIRQVGSIQFDPLNQVGRNPDLVLQSRIKNYRPGLLQGLLYTDRKLLDGWDKNMSIYPREDWPYFRRYRQYAYQKYLEASPHLRKIIPQVRKELEEQGPLSSRDLKFDTKVDWPWGKTRAARAALESMYNKGELIIHHKEGTRKVYDLADKYLDKELITAPEPNLTEEEYEQWYVLRRIGAIGLLWSLSGDAWLGIRGLNKKKRTAALTRLVREEKAIEVGVEGIDYPCYIPAAESHLLQQIMDSEQHDLGLVQPQAAIIAPLDNLIWDRKLTKQLFNFYYVWEVYKPVEQREFGYYVLPILYGDRFVARFEPTFDKKKKILLIKNWWWEQEDNRSAELNTALKECFRQFLDYLGGDKIKFVGRTGVGKEVKQILTSL